MAASAPRPSPPLPPPTSPPSCAPGRIGALVLYAAEAPTVGRRHRSGVCVGGSRGRGDDVSCLRSSGAAPRAGGRVGRPWQARPARSPSARRQCRRAQRCARSAGHGHGTHPASTSFIHKLCSLAPMYSARLPRAGRARCTPGQARRLAAKTQRPHHHTLPTLPPPGGGPTQAHGRRRPPPTLPPRGAAPRPPPAHRRQCPSRRARRRSRRPTGPPLAAPTLCVADERVAPDAAGGLAHARPAPWHAGAKGVAAATRRGRASDGARTGGEARAAPKRRPRPPRGGRVDPTPRGACGRLRQTGLGGGG